MRQFTCNMMTKMSKQVYGLLILKFHRSKLYIVNVSLLNIKRIYIRRNYGQ